MIFIYKKLINQQKTQYADLKLIILLILKDFNKIYNINEEFILYLNYI